MTDESKFKKDLADAINRNGMENGSDTPDMVLAEFLSSCLDAFSKAVDMRNQWSSSGEAKKEISTELRRHFFEDMASHSHDSWSEWMEYLFDRSTFNEDGSVTIPKELVFRWSRQMKTKYKELSEKEKASDRKQAKKILKIMFDKMSEELFNGPVVSAGGKDGQ